MRTCRGQKTLTGLQMYSLKTRQGKQTERQNTER